MRKCYEESLKPNTIVVALLPSRTDTKWFHEYVNGKAVVQFIKGRLHFNDGKYGATFGSIVAIYGLEYGKEIE